MTIGNQKRLGRLPLAALLLGGCFLFCERAGAVVFAPGGLAEPTPGTITFAGLTPLADETFSVTGYDQSVPPVARYTATVESKVLREPGTGILDFAYQVTNTSPLSQPDSLHTVSVTGYRNYTTDVDYVTGTGAVTYDTVQRKAPFGGIAVSMDYTPVANAIAAGDATDWIIIRTNATSFDNNGSTSLIDGATASVVSYEPVPEPVSIGVFVLGAAAMLSRRWRRPNQAV
jgi:hypothetical protein